MGGVSLLFFLHSHAAGNASAYNVHRVTSLCLQGLGELGALGSGENGKLLANGGCVDFPLKLEIRLQLR